MRNFVLKFHSEMFAIFSLSKLSFVNKILFQNIKPKLKHHDAILMKIWRNREKTDDYIPPDIVYSRQVSFKYRFASRKGIKRVSSLGKPFQ